MGENCTAELGDAPKKLSRERAVLFLAHSLNLDKLSKLFYPFHIYLVLNALVGHLFLYLCLISGSKLKAVL